LSSAPGTARAHVGIVLAGWQMSGISDTAELVASELVTNALNASTTDEGEPRYVDGRMALIWVCLMSDGLSRLLIEVHDQMEGQPVIKDADSEAESGRGLYMVDTLTEGWGWYPKIGHPGKCVWAVLALPP
jgi:hypothetical protein